MKKPYYWQQLWNRRGGGGLINLYFPEDVSNILDTINGEAAGKLTPTPAERGAEVVTAREVRPKGEMTQRRTTYDRFATRYDRFMRPLEGGVLARLRADLVARLPAGARLLELGAGTGANFPFYPAGARGVASEPNGEMLRRAATNQRRPAGVWLVQAAAERLPFADAAFDAALATLVFCTVAEPSAAFAELRRVVRPGGMVALLEHVRPPGLLGPVFDALNLFTAPLLEDHFNRRTADEARRAGLRVESVDKHLRGVIQTIVCRNGS